MCGIAGYTHFDRKESCVPLRRAMDRLRHRGPDRQGIFESATVALGCARLKIIDLDGGDQPMSTDNGDLIAIFNGEIYNHAEIRERLEGLGHKFQSRCDTEVVLRAFSEWDVECFRQFRGMFAAAFWRQSQRRLVLVRDRLGIKPLYYAIRHGNVYFGSELKAIFEFPQLPRQLSREALAYFLAMNYVPGPLTMVDGIEKLPPGSWLEARRDGVRRGVYWRNSFEPDVTIDGEEAREELDRLLDSAVREHLTSDVPIGVWASGGLDSSTIVHYAAQAVRGRLQTFSVTFSGQRFDEGAYVRELSRRYDTKHHEFDLHSELDLTAAIHDIAEYSDEPGADAGALPVWLLSKLTKKNAVVALSGEGADEIFGGYQTYVADHYGRRMRRLPLPLLRVMLRCARCLPVSDEKIGLEYKLKRFLAGALLPADEAHFFWNGTFSKTQRQLLGMAHHEGSMRALYQALPSLPNGADGLARYLFVDQHYYLPDDILYKCDRMGMAHSLEVRPPFLDHRIVEFAAKLPTRLKIEGRSTKRILRSLMRDKLPAAILRRPKQGFDIPAHQWLRGPLRSLLLDTLSEEAVRDAGIFPPNVISNLIHQHLERQANLGYHLWGLLVLHLWARRWNIETSDPAGDRWCADLVSTAK